MKITHSYHKHVGEFLKSSVHAKECHLELEVVFTGHKFKITIIGLARNPYILTDPAD